MTDEYRCPKCGGEFKVVEVYERKTGRKMYGLECGACEYLDFDTQYFDRRNE